MKDELGKFQWQMLLFGICLLITIWGLYLIVAGRGGELFDYDASRPLTNRRPKIPSFIMLAFGIIGLFSSGKKLLRLKRRK